MSEPILSVQGVSKRFDTLVAVADVDLDVARGEKLGIIGPNGSGKTTLINCITGVLRPEQGTITFEGIDISRMPAYRRARRGIARSFQIPRPFVGMSVIENLLVPLDYVERRQKETAAARVNSRRGRARGARRRSSRIAHPSRVAQARACARARRRASAADRRRGHGRTCRSREIDEVLEILFALNARGVTVIMIEHIMHAIMRFSKRLVCMETGTHHC